MRLVGLRHEAESSYALSFTLGGLLHALCGQVHEDVAASLPETAGALHPAARRGWGWGKPAATREIATAGRWG